VIWEEFTSRPILNWLTALNLGIEQLPHFLYSSFPDKAVGFTARTSDPLSLIAFIRYHTKVIYCLTCLNQIAISNHAAKYGEAILCATCLPTPPLFPARLLAKVIVANFTTPLPVLHPNATAPWE
jgi:hypothetical protein